MSELDDSSAEETEAPETAETEASEEPSKPYKAPGLWPGVTELLFFLILCLLHSNMNKEVEPGSEDGLLPMVGMILWMSVIFWVFGRRHKKRTKKYPNHSPLVRMRDLHMVCLLGFFSSTTTGLFSESNDIQEASMLSFAMGIVVLFVVSKTWGALCGSKSYLWGAVFALSGLAHIYMGYSSLDPALEGFKVITEGPEPLQPVSTALSPALLLLGYFLQGVSFLFGGFALFQDEADRAENQKKLIRFFRLGIMAMGYGFVFGAIAVIPEGLDNDKFIENLTTPFIEAHLLIAGLYYWVAARAMKTHLWNMDQPKESEDAA